jgi:hypothetical protein
MNHTKLASSSKLLAQLVMYLDNATDSVNLSAACRLLETLSKCQTHEQEMDAVIKLQLLQAVRITLFQRIEVPFDE